MKRILVLALLLGAGSAFAKEGQFQSTQKKKQDVIQRRPVVAAGDQLQPKASGVVVMMSERGFEIFSPLAPAEMGRGEKLVTQNIKNTGPASNPSEDKKPFGGIVLVGLEF